VRKFLFNKNNYGYIFIIPFFASFFIFLVYPVFYSLYISFMQHDGISPAVFVGLDNYKRLITDKFFIKSVINTWRIWLVGFIPQMIFGLGLAYLFSRFRIKVRNFFRALYYLPNLMTAAAIGALFGMVLGRNSGAVNQLLIKIGLIDEPIFFLGSPTWSSTAVSAIQWWLFFGLTIILFMAGIKAIPETYYEAASIDGASSWDAFWRITLPLLKPIMIYVLVTSLIGGMQIFDVPFTITKGPVIEIGGPQKSLLTMAVYMYTTAFNYNNRGYGAAVAWALFLIIVIFSILIFYFLRNKDYGRRGIRK